MASYAYDTFGAVTLDTDAFSNGWRNPYLYDGKDRVRYDVETGLYWMSVRAYDPTLGRFISRDPLGRAPLMGWDDQPYAYAGNNPLINVDPSGQLRTGERWDGGQVARPVQTYTARAVTKQGTRPKRPTAGQIKKARQIAQAEASRFTHIAWWAGGFTALVTLASAAAFFIATQAASNPLEWIASYNFGRVAVGFALVAAQFGVLAFEAGLIAHAFSDEAAEPDSWWTVAHVVEFGRKLGKIVLGFSAFEAAVGFALRAFSAIGAGAFGFITLVGQALVSLVGIGVIVARAVKNQEYALQ